MLFNMEISNSGINMFFVIFIIIIATFWGMYWWFGPEIRGAIGEGKIAIQLSLLPTDEYRVLNNIFLKTESGYSQIDHIVIAESGIFVIETKNYSGWIHGHESSEYWTQTIYNWKSKFRNPIKQNWSHIYALKELLSELGNIPYYPVVVFTGNAILKNVSCGHPVMYNTQLAGYIREKNNIKSISIVDVHKIEFMIARANIVDKQIRKQHIAEIGSRVYKRQENEELMICPKCSGKLVVRDGKYGGFYGCSNYPKCRYTASLR